MGLSRGTAARLERVYGGRIRRWLCNTALRAEALLGRREAAESVVRDLLEHFGEHGAAEMSLAQMQALIRAKADGYCRPEPGEAELMANVAVLGGLLGLNAVERDVLAFFAAVPTQPALQQTMQLIDVRSRHQVAMALAVVLGQPVEAVRSALSGDSPLTTFQIINVWNAPAYDFAAFALLNEELQRTLTSVGAEVDQVLGAFFSKSPAPTLQLSDYDHLQPRVATLLAYLRGAEAHKAVGVNVLLYGLPGTGKTELARLIARELGWQGYEVRIANRDGTPSSGDERIGSYLLAQRFLKRMKARLVIFDEVEDLFSTEYGFSRAKLGKLYMNRLLETNAVPAVFIANAIEALSLAVRRRFDFSVTFGPLPGKARARVLRRHLAQSGVSHALMVKLTRRELLLPAQVTLAKKVASLANAGEDVIVEALDASMRLLEQPMPRASEPLAFDVALANADIDVDGAVRGLCEKRRAVVALYGPPGVGKSALAGYIAERLERTAVRVAASDLLSSFLGETEQRIATVFEAIDASSEVVVLEEAEEFLAWRDGTRHSWEIRMANELLTQLDAFTGVIVLTTNAIERIDGAALRRCELKIKLDYMRPEQREAMWTRQRGRPASEKIAKALRALATITAGDFVAVARQAAIVGAAWREEDWLAALTKELALRPSTRKPLGFVAP